MLNIHIPVKYNSKYTKINKTNEQDLTHYSFVKIQCDNGFSRRLANFCPVNDNGTEVLTTIGSQGKVIL